MKGCTSCDEDISLNHSDREMCIEGIIYGPCSSELCGGACEPFWACSCDCHKQESKEAR